MTPKATANERRLAKLLREAEMSDLATWEAFAAFLAKRGVLAVCAATVPDGLTTQLDHVPAIELRYHLSRLARGTR